MGSPILQFLRGINLIPFMASSKEQGLAGLDISFFTFTFKAPATAIKKKKRLMYLFKHSSYKMCILKFFNWNIFSQRIIKLFV